MFRKISMHVGINDYPGSGMDLQGCVNDANDWREFAERHGYEPYVLLDAAATRNNYIDMFSRLLASLRWGDRFLQTYSGHGTFAPDLNNDESDRRDEALVMYDYANGGIILDDDIQKIIATNKRRGVRIYIFSDSCHSGTVSRFALRDLPHNATPKFFPPSLIWPDYQQLDLPATARTARPAYTNDAMLISGCEDNEYSYDAWFPNELGTARANGAFTRAALDTHMTGITMRRWHTEILKYLAGTAFDQHPKLTGTAWQRGWRV